VVRVLYTYSKDKVLPCSFPSVGPGDDVGQPVSLQVTLSHLPGGRLPLPSVRPLPSWYQIILHGDKRHMRVSSLPKAVT